MPKKKPVRARRAAQEKARTTRSTAPEREPTMLDRLKKNPFSVLLGVIVIGSMVLGLAAEIVQSSRPQVYAPTPTLIVYDTPTPAPVSTAPAATAVPTVGNATATPVARVAPATATSVKQAPAARKTYSAAPAMTIDKSKKYTATILTNKGSIRLQLYADVAPITVNSFVFLAREGFYDGLTFHRVIDFVAQGGDPLGTGGGGPGYTIPYEAGGKTHIVGALGMARAADINSAGSQFYIVKTPAPWLDPPQDKYTIFGQTIEGMDVVNKLVVGDIMQKVTIEEQ